MGVRTYYPLLPSVLVLGAVLGACGGRDAAPAAERRPRGSEPSPPGSAPASALPRPAASATPALVTVAVPTDPCGDPQETALRAAVELPDCGALYDASYVVARTEAGDAVFLSWAVGTFGPRAGPSERHVASYVAGAQVDRGAWHGLSPRSDLDRIALLVGAALVEHRDTGLVLDAADIRTLVEQRDVVPFPSEAERAELDARVRSRLSDVALGESVDHATLTAAGLHVAVTRSGSS